MRGCVRERPCSPLIGSDRSHDKLWEAEVMGGHGRPKVGGHGRLWETMWEAGLSDWL